MELTRSTSCLSSLSLISLQPLLRSSLPCFPLCFKPPSVSPNGHQHLHLFAFNHTAPGAAPAADHLFVDDDDDDDDVILPLEKMDKWLQTKPRGFGEGKEYNTEIEDKLLDEMLLSSQPLQTSLSNSKPNDNKKQAGLDGDGDVKSKDASQVITGGVRVRLGNLPKKKNVHRDLKAAFKGVPGILAISPAVSGNKKTKDPVCKGFAFVHFTTLEQATRFVQQFSGQCLEFGKIKKPVKCEIVQSSPQNEVAVSTETSAAIGQLDYQTDAEADEMELPESGENPHLARSLEPMVSDNNRGQRVESASHPVSLDHQPKKPKVVVKKMVTKRQVPKIPRKHSIPGSVSKLKFKEKTILTGVFSKYGPKTALTAMENGATP